MTFLDRGTRYPELRRLNEVWIEDAIQTAVSRLHALGERAMEQHFFQNRHPSGTVPKPGPSHPLLALAHRLSESGLEDGIDKWEWESTDGVWNWVENREGLQHPLAVFVPILMMNVFRQKLDADFAELAEDLDEILGDIESQWKERFAASELAQSMKSMAREV